MGIDRTYQRCRRVLAAWLALACLTTLAAAQRAGEASVRAYLSGNVVRLGDRVALIVVAENGTKAEIPRLPEVPGLAIGPLRDPDSKYSVESFNGRVTRSVTLTWVIPLGPSEVGEYTIPPFEVRIDGSPRQTGELRLNVVKDMRGEDLGFLEIKPSSQKVIVGQPFSLELVFGFDSAIADKTNYGNLALSWWGNLPGLLENELPKQPAGRRLEIYLNDRQTIEVEQLDARELRGRSFVTLRVLRSFTPTRTGTIEIPTGFFEFGQVVERRDFFQTRREKGDTYFARAPDVSIEVVPLPEEGRPLDYGGAIGKLAVRADATPRDVDAGESIKLKLTWTGAGNLEFFSPPDLARSPAFRDFRVYGKTEEKSFEHRTVVYDVAPVTSRVQAIPPVPLSVYDPEAERYVVVQSEPIPIRVRALEGASGLELDDEERFAKDVRDVVLRPAPERQDTPLGAARLLGTLGAIPVGWLVLRAFVRRRFDPDAPAERARRRARKLLARGLSRSTDARSKLDRVHEFLAARTNSTREAWIGWRVGEHLGGAQPERLRPLDDTIAELERAVWGGHPAQVSDEQIMKSVDEALRGGL